MLKNPNTRIWNSRQGLAYVRVSKEDQEDSAEGQLLLIDTAMKAHGMTFLEPPFIDDGRRGSDEQRSALLALLEFCRSHPVRPRSTADYVPIFVQATDRLGRFLDPMKIFTYLNELKELGYDVYSTSEKIRYIGGNIGDWIQLVVRSDQATGYSVRLSHDSLRGGLQIAEKGYLTGGSPGYGYDRAVVGRDAKPRYRYTSLPGKKVAKYSMDGTLLATLEPVLRKGKIISPSLDKSNSDHVTRILGDAHKVDAVKRVWELFVDEHRGFRTIADTLNREGYPPPRSRRWLASAVRSIIVNPLYMGAAVYGRKSKSKYHEFSIERTDDRAQITIEKKEIFRKGYVCREMEECVVVHDAHPAIICKERWYRAQEILAEKTQDSTPKRTGRGAHSPYLLTGLIKCARCGYNFQGDSHRRTGWKSYQCGGYVAGGRSVCVRANVSAEQIESWIVGQMRERLLDGRAALFDSYDDLEAAVQAEVASQGRSDVPEVGDRKAIELSLLEKRRKLELILTGLSPDNLDVANELIRTLKREIKGLEEDLRLRKAKARPTWAVDAKAAAHEAAGYLWNLKEVMGKGTTEERRRIIDYFVAAVKVNSKEGWAEAEFYESPALPTASFCMAPPTGFEPVSRP